MGKRSWFGVKSLYRWEAVGEPRTIDADYDPDATLIEERVVLVRAGSDKKAVRKGKREAERYAAETHTNPYGQEVRTRRIKVLQIWPVFWGIKDKCEVWSDTEPFAASVSDKEIEDRRFGRDEPGEVRRKRRKFGLANGRPTA